MAMEVPNDVKPSPEFTTVSRYTVTRIGEPSLFVEFMETSRTWTNVEVLMARDENNDEVFEVLVLKTGQEEVPGGAVLYDGTTVVGTVASSSKPTLYQEVVLSGGGLASSAEKTLRTPVINKFGNEVHVPSGRTWSYMLHASRVSHLAKMQKALGLVAVELVEQALGQLSVTRSRAQIKTAIEALASEGITIDTLIAAELEDLERQRRNKTWEPEGSTTSGEVPGV